MFLKLTNEFSLIDLKYKNLMEIIKINQKQN